jgi:bifunctional ADP-heptose synthase (sugar kinase/adenylyltransferase)
VEETLPALIDREDDWIVRDPEFTTVVKQRFVEPYITGKELTKLFAVNYIDNAPPRPETQTALSRKMGDRIAEFDLVVVADFGHGLMQKEQREIVQQSAPFMSLNCQTNSNNHGFNIISRQYERAHAFSLDEQELLLSCARRPIEYMQELDNLRQSFQAQYAWLTRGAVETIGLHNENEPSLCLPFETAVIDTVGAGDAFFSVASLAAARQLPIDLATFLGQLAGGQAVKLIGNQKPISKQALLKGGMTLLNF